MKIPIPDPRTAVAWTVAGSDPSGGAGIQIDLKVMSAFGVHGCSIITALTAQNTEGVHSIEPVSESMLCAQLDALRTDLPPAAIKSGMLGSAASCRMLSDYYAGLQPCPPALVCDPVLRSTSGTDLLDEDARMMLVQHILPHTTVLTPNLPETESILGRPCSMVEEAAEQLLAYGARSVLIKGGHAEGTDCRDYWTDGRQCMWLSSPRIETTATHGTGCILSAAIASGIALGRDIREAVIDAKTFLNQCLRTPAGLGSGFGPMLIQPFRNAPEDRSQVQ